MPLYEYRCSTHGVFEARQSINDAGLPGLCPACGAPAGRRYSVLRPIVRPHGYHLHPGEPGYSDFRRAAELGEIKDPDANSHLSAGAPTEAQQDAAIDAEFKRAFTDDMRQEVHHMVRAAIE